MKSIDELFPVLPEYEHVFNEHEMTCVLGIPDNLRIVVVKPSWQKGFWHFSIMHLKYGFEDYTKRGAIPGAVCYFLKENEVPGDENLWKKSEAVAEPPPSVAIPTSPKVRPAPQRSNVVYFIRAGDFIKIGFTSKNVAARVRDFKTGCTLPTEILGTMPGGISDERQLHSRFAHLRSSGEWFHAKDELISFIKEKVEA